MNKPSVILDKSFIQGVSGSRFSELSENHHFLMPDVLFFELISTKEKVRSSCFFKLPNKINPISVTKHNAYLMQYELNNHEPAGPPSENTENLPFRFNPGLATGEYKLTESDAVEIQRIENELQISVSTLISQSELIVSMFPDIEKGSDADRKSSLLQAQEFIASDTEELSDFLSKLIPPNNKSMPESSLLNKSWALFRWLQVSLLYGLDFRLRHGSLKYHQLTPNQQVRLEHEVLDMQYLLQGVLENAFATQETKLKEYFALLCPEGLLIYE